MEAFIESWGFFTRWLGILALGAPVGAVALFVAAVRFARRRGVSLEFTDGALFGLAGSVLTPTLITAVAIPFGALGPEVTTLRGATDLLFSTLVLSLVLGILTGIALGFVAAWFGVRRGAVPGGRTSCCT
jgi:hypothetical protein